MMLHVLTFTLFRRVPGISIVSSSAGADRRDLMTVRCLILRIDESEAIEFYLCEEAERALELHILKLLLKIVHTIFKP